jgi:hypothetical protein
LFRGDRLAPDEKGGHAARASNEVYRVGLEMMQHGATNARELRVQKSDSVVQSGRRENGTQFAREKHRAGDADQIIVVCRSAGGGPRIEAGRVRHEEFARRDLT